MNEILEGMKAEARRTILLSKDAKAIDRANDVLRLIEVVKYQNEWLESCLNESEWNELEAEIKDLLKGGQP